MAIEREKLVRTSEGDVTSVRVLWWLLGLVALAGLGEAGWLGNAVVSLESQVAALNAKVDFLIRDNTHQELYRGAPVAGDNRG